VIKNSLPYYGRELILKYGCTVCSTDHKYKGESILIAIINKAVLHIMDFNSGTTVFSERELDIQSSSVQTFLTKHIEKLYGDSSSQSGSFFPTSEFKKRMSAYIGGSLDFLSFSLYVAESIHSALTQSDAPDPADVVVCDVTVEESRLLAVLKCNNKVGFTHQVITAEGTIKNDIIHHFAILPSPTQKIDEYAFIDTQSLKIRFNDKKRSVDGENIFVLPEKVLECSSAISPKKAVDLVNSITRKVSEGPAQTSVAAVTKAKSYLVENATKSEYLDPIALGQEVFRSSPLLQDEYMKELRNSDIPNVVKVDMDLAIKKGKNHRIKTDTGIEIAFPADYFKNTDYIEIINNPDGTLSIALKNIGKIINS
jgi:hypothetical protein